MNDEEHENLQKKNAESPEWNTWVVASGNELREAFGLTVENRPTIKLNPEYVPDGLKALIPYAEEWGIADDLIRDDSIRKASPEAIQDLISTLSSNLDSLYEWLAGPEANLDEQTQEYHTFSALLMAYEEAKYS